MTTKPQNWLPLLQFSTKHNISLSTLRRRIKAKTIEFRLDQGKYFILEDGEQDRNLQAPFIETTTLQDSVAPGQSRYVEASVLSSAHRLVDEIKSAYSKVLQGKEEQISQLKEEIIDLRMLVRILETQSAPASTEKKSSAPSQDKARGESTDNENFLFGEREF